MTISKRKAVWIAIGISFLAYLAPMPVAHTILPFGYFLFFIVDLLLPEFSSQDIETWRLILGLALYFALGIGAQIVAAYLYYRIILWRNPWRWIVLVVSLPVAPVIVAIGYAVAVFTS